MFFFGIRARYNFKSLIYWWHKVFIDFSCEKFRKSKIHWIHFASLSNFASIHPMITVTVNLLKRLKIKSTTCCLPNKEYANPYPILIISSGMVMYMVLLWLLERSFKILLSCLEDYRSKSPRFTHAVEC